MKVSRFIKIMCVLLAVLAALYASSSRPDEERANERISLPDRGLDDSEKPVPIETPFPYDAIVIARYLKSKVVSKKNFVEEVMKSNDLSKAIGGRIYTFEVSQQVCQVKEGKKRSWLTNGKRIEVFNEAGSGFYYPYESSKSYILYISELPDQEKLKRDFDLDKRATFYNPFPLKGEETSRDRIKALGNEPDPMALTRLKQECQRSGLPN